MQEELVVLELVDVLVLLLVEVELVVVVDDDVSPGEVLLVVDMVDNVEAVE